MTISRVAADVEVRQADERNKEVIFKYCTPFIDCISEISHKQIMQKFWIL